METIKVSTGVVLELSQFRKNNKLPWSKFHSWMKIICLESTLPPLASMKLSIYRLENKIKQLKQNHHVTILEINAFFNTLIIKLDIWSQDASVLLQGDAELYSDYPPLKDEIWHYLITPTEHDATTQEVLEILCHAFSMLLSQLPQDHLLSGTHYNPSAHLIN